MDQSYRIVYAISGNYEKSRFQKKNVYMIQINSVRIFRRNGLGVVCKDTDDSKNSAPSPLPPSQDAIFLKAY